MRNLGGLALDKARVPAQLGNASFEGAARAGAAEKEKHRQHFVAQVWVRFVQGAFALEVPGNVQNSLNFLFAEIKIANQVSTV